MIDKTSVIFGNQIDKKTIKSAEKSKQKYIKKFGFGSKTGIDLNGESNGILFNLDKISIYSEISSSL